jgi:FkbM family methyltransferase
MREIVPPGIVHLWRRARGQRTTRKALNQLDDALVDILPLTAGYYLEMGANDGIQQSNTYWLEVERGWRGMLIEPSLNRYFELRANRSETNDFACVACVAFDYPHEFVKLSYADLMTTAPDLSTELPDAAAHVASAQEHLPAHQETVVFGALARPLQAVLDDAGAPATIDFFSLDVEGAELEVLKGVDHDRTRFRHLLVETRSPDKVTELLAGHGYRRRAQLSVHDYLFEDSRDPSGG